jgi:hypothetical protein
MLADMDRWIMEQIAKARPAEEGLIEYHWVN